MNSKFSIVSALCTLTAFNLSMVSCQLYQQNDSYVSSAAFDAAEGGIVSLVDCGALCDRSSSCKAFCYSQSSALCYLSQPSKNSTLVMAGAYGSGFSCFVPVGCQAYPGYELYGTRCIKAYMTGKPYAEARSICAQDGGHLYHMKSLELDRQPLLDLIAVEGHLIYSWLGADDLQTEGQFVWSDFANTPVAAELWGSGQPDNGGGSVEDCTHLHMGYLMNDNRCDEVRRFVCQIDV